MSIRSKGTQFGIRVIRKMAHIGGRTLSGAAELSNRIENKATRILDGTDFSIKINSTDPLEKIYYSKIPLILPLNPALPRIGQEPSVVLLIPSLDAGSFYGGAATALIVAAKVALKVNRPLSILQTTKTGASTGLQQFFDREGIDINVEKSVRVSTVAGRAYNIYGYVPMHPDDIFIASAWWDAHVLHNLPMQYKFIYLIQDFEPIFYNNSDQYVLAEQTYKNTDFIPLCNTKLMFDFMNERGYPSFSSDSATFFEPAVSRAKDNKHLAQTNEKRKTLFLYGRPNVHRNLFFTALDALDYAFSEGFLDPKGWDVYMAGDSKLPNIKLSSGPTIVNKGKMPIEKYIEFCNTVDVAISPMMAPHPNYPTLELSSVGAQVVTTRYANKVNLSNYSPNIIMCDISTESMAGAIKEAAKKAATRKPSRSKNSSLPATWSEALDSSLDHVIKHLL